jgi:DNA-binding GntR family transcriptional regulator
MCRASGNAIVLTLWEALARHVLIVFGHEIRDERDAEIMEPQHRELRDLLAAGDADALLGLIGSHITRLRGVRSLPPEGEVAAKRADEG